MLIYNYGVCGHICPSYWTVMYHSCTTHSDALPHHMATGLYTRSASAPSASI